MSLDLIKGNHVVCLQNKHKELSLLHIAYFTSTGKQLSYGKITLTSNTNLLILLTLWYKGSDVVDTTGY